MPEAGKHDKDREQADEELPLAGSGSAGSHERDETSSPIGFRTEAVDSGQSGNKADLIGSVGITDAEFNQTLKRLKAKVGDAVTRLFGASEDLLPASARDNVYSIASGPGESGDAPPGTPVKPNTAADSPPSRAQPTADAGKPAEKPVQTAGSETANGATPGRPTDTSARDATEKPASQPESERLPELVMENAFNAELLARMQRANGRVCSPEALQDLQQRMDALAKTALFREDLRPAARLAQNLRYTEEYARNHPLIREEDWDRRVGSLTGRQSKPHSADYLHYKAAESKAKNERKQIESKIDRICTRRTEALQKVFNSWLTDHGEKPQLIRLDKTTPLDYKSVYKPEASHVRAGEMEVSRHMLLAAGEDPAWLSTVLVHEGVAHEKQMSDAVRSVIKNLPADVSNREIRMLFFIRTSYNGHHLTDAEIADAKEFNRTHPWTAEDEKRANEYLDGIKNYRSSFGGPGEDTVHSLHTIRENLAALRDNPHAAATDIFDRMFGQKSGGKYGDLFRGDARPGSLRRQERYGDELSKRLFGQTAETDGPEIKAVFEAYDNYCLAHVDEATGKPRKSPGTWDAAAAGKALVLALEKREAELSHAVEEMHKPYSENALEKWAHQSTYLLDLANNPQKLFKEQPRAILDVADFVNHSGRITPVVEAAMRQSLPTLQDFVKQFPEQAVDSLTRLANNTNSAGADLLRRTGALEVVSPLISLLPPESAAKLQLALAAGGGGGDRAGESERGSASDRKGTDRGAGPDRGSVADRGAGPDRGSVADRGAGPDRGSVADRGAGPDRGSVADKEAGPDGRIGTDKGTPPERGTKDNPTRGGRPGSAEEGSRARQSTVSDTSRSQPGPASDHSRHPRAADAARPASVDDAVMSNPQDPLSTRYRELMKPVLDARAGGKPLDAAEEQRLMQQAAKELLPYAKEAAKKLGIPPELITEKTIEVKFLSGRGGEYDFASNRVRVVPEHGDPKRVIDHELRHMHDALMTKALRTIDNQTFEARARGQALFNVGRGGLRHDGSERLIIKDQVTRAELQRLVADCSKHFGAGLPDVKQVDAWLAKQKVSENLLLTTRNRAALAVELRSEVAQISQILAQQIPDALVKADPVLAGSLAELAKKYRWQQWKDKHGSLSNNPEFNKYTRSLSQDTSGLGPDRGSYRFSINEIRARRAEFSRALARELGVGDASSTSATRFERLKSQDARIAAREIRYGVISEQLLKNFEKSLLTRGDTSAEHWKHAQEQARELLKMSSPKSEADVQAMSFLGKTGLLSSQELAAKGFQIVEREVSKINTDMQAPERDKKAAEQTVQDVRDSKAGSSNVLPGAANPENNGTDYVLKRPITIEPGTADELTILAIHEHDGKYTVTVVDESGRVHKRDARFFDDAFGSLNEALKDDKLKSDPKRYVDVLSYYLDQRGMPSEVTARAQAESGLRRTPAGATQENVANRVLDRTLQSAQTDAGKKLESSKQGDSTIYPMDKVTLRLSKGNLELDAVEVINGKLYLRSAKDGKRYASEPWLDLLREGLKGRAAGAATGDAAAVQAKALLERFNAEPEVRVALLQSLGRNMSVGGTSGAASETARAPQALAAAADAPHLVRDRRRTGARHAGTERSSSDLARGTGDIRRGAAGYEVNTSGTGPRSAQRDTQASDLKVEDLARLEKDIMDDKGTTAEEKRRALEALRLARDPVNREARDAVVKAQREGKRSGAEGAEGHAVGVALVALTLAGWYASYKMNRVQDNYIPSASVN